MFCALLPLYAPRNNALTSRSEPLFKFWCCWIAHPIQDERLFPSNISSNSSNAVSSSSVSGPTVGRLNGTVIALDVTLWKLRDKCTRIV